MENPFDFGLSSAQIQAFDLGLGGKIQVISFDFSKLHCITIFQRGLASPEESRIEGGGIRNSVRKVYQLKRNLSLVYIPYFARDF